MNLWQLILAAMLQLQAPGKSIYSVVPAAHDAPAPCDHPHLRCRKPWWDKAHKSHVTVETWRQGLDRYVTISRALERVVRSKSRKSIPRHLLIDYVLTISCHESGFRRDVHSGVGSAARGDCKWRKGPKGEAIRIPGSCRSVSLVQRLYPNPKHRVNGWGPEELVGLDQASTERALVTAARAVDRFYHWCYRYGPERAVARCVFGMYGGLGAASSDSRINDRVKTYWRLRNSPKQLGARARDALGLSTGTASASPAS